MEDGERKPEGEPSGRPEPGAGSGDEREAAGVFGSLPRTRPGRRSPRRAPAAAAAPVTEEPTEPPSPPREAEAAERVLEPSAEQETDRDEAPSPAGQGGLEDLAWAGIAIAAEAATLGLRLANRALEAMRGDAERP
jgi:hypothetical protein